MFAMPTPTTERVVATRTTSVNALSTAAIVRNRLFDLADKFDTASVFAMATSRHPKASLPEAVIRLLEEVDHAIKAVAAHSAQFRALEDAEKERLKPIVRAATNRLFTTIDTLNRMDSYSRSREGQEQLERGRLEAAGLTKAEIDALRPPHDVAAERATREALTTERKSLEAFLKQCDETLLPSGFVAALAEQASQAQHTEAVEVA